MEEEFEGRHYSDGEEEFEDNRVPVEVKTIGTKQVPLPSEPRPLYEVLPEVKGTAKSNEIYQSGHGYLMPDQKEGKGEAPTAAVSIAKETVDEGEGEKKKEKKKEKPKFKF